MKESFWGAAIVAVGIFSIFFIYFFQSLTNTDEHNYHLLKETTEAAMLDAVDLAEYRKSGNVKIDREKFIENFIRSFSQNVTLARTYKVEFYDINETPPKVSLRVSSAEKTAMVGEVYEFNISNYIDAILEVPSDLSQELEFKG